MAKLEVTENQLHLIQRALDFYSRVGIGQFDEIKNHPTFERHLHNEFKDQNGKTDYTRYHSMRSTIDNALVHPRNMLYNNIEFGNLHGGWGIHHPNVDDSCREAFDIIQVIRHEFWKRNPERSNITVNSSIHFTSDKGESNKIKCEL